MSTPTVEPGPARNPAPQNPAQAVDWSDFRDHLTTADQEGRRRWIYAKKPAGQWYRWRTWFSWLLLFIMFAGPFVRIHGNPLLLVNLVERRFYILGQVFWPQDAILFAVAMLLFLTGVILFTTAFGRLWCGWACPQTVMMEMVFRKLEYLIDGDAVEQRALAAAPWGGVKLFKRAFKLGVFFALSFLVGNTLLAYIIGSDALGRIVTDDPHRHLVGLTFMILFTLLFFGIFTRFREQACTFICPYGRFQSAMLDENSLVVAYDHRRGERRAHYHRDETAAQRAAAGVGDCIDCQQCVVVCPTGIDIRNGVQMECVHCTACIDACDAVMDRTHRPRGLVRYASLNSIEQGRPFRFTARMAVYAGVLAVLATLFAVLLFTRPPVEGLFLRAPGTLYLQTADGKVENLYTVKLVNKTLRDLPVELRLENAPGTLKVMGAAPVVPAAQLLQTSVLVDLDPAALTGPTTKLKIGIYSQGKLLHTVKTVFVSPRTHSQP
jgi:cytochrome c oxidase accessory protein FixG